MKIRTFTCLNGLELIVKHRKSAVIFEMNQDQINNKHGVTYIYEPKDFLELFNYIEMISKESWANLTSKEADSLGADYYEYYDKELDSNGYLSIRENTLLIDRPYLESNKLYQFNKRKMESFIHEFNKLIVNE
ncbi:hypothetical protein NV379_02375 [Paenibacillus sp. N1-5-1-14]|uniref:hypothetical protein n=1 Tax=Paenibacillus radicibacter TaxID=2972488 RepID=UPI002158BA5A|nr:hypothetical protein [Paenibacillus radicibacter]MCR8641493.1 hypothetical protein [Paenibacillus radicibacter]